MNNVSKTLYIPLYGKALVSRKGIILRDRRAEEIWAAEGFALKGKAKSKWLAYYMGMRAAAFDSWLRARMAADAQAVVVHLGCGMDSRIERVGADGHDWYDVDFPAVIAERRRYYAEGGTYHLLGADVRETDWLDNLPVNRRAIVVMEGVSMYFQPEELARLLRNLKWHFAHVHVLMDCYTVLAAKASRYKNPINAVGVTQVYGVDAPESAVENTGLRFVQAHEMTPGARIDELRGMEKWVFRQVFAGAIAKKLYRLYEYESE